MRAVGNRAFLLTLAIILATGISACSGKGTDTQAAKQTPTSEAPASKPADMPKKPAMPASKPAEMPKPDATMAGTAPDGKAVYNQGCVACHAMAIAGSPKFGDAEAWAPRIAKGMDVLYQHSINGFQGDAGIMPPKGGRIDLSDEAIKAAVDYMVAAAQPK